MATFGAATPGFNSLISASSIPSLISTEPAELLCRANYISSTDPFCFVKQKQKTVQAFLQFLFTNMRRTKIHGDKGCHAALITIKQGNQHAVPNRNPKHNQAETTIHYLFRHVHLLTRIAKIDVVTIYIYIYEQMHLSYTVYESNIWPYLTTGQRPKKDNATKERRYN